MPFQSAENTTMETFSQHGHQDERSHHRKVPERLPLRSERYPNHDNLDVNGFLDHPPEDDDSGWQESFATSAASKFPGQDTTGSLGHSHHGHSHNHSVHNHAHSRSQNRMHYDMKAPADTSTTTLHSTHTPLEIRYTGSKITAALTSLLIALPFVLISLVQVSPFELVEPENESKGGTFLRARAQSRYLSFLGVCSLTAATLVTVGFVGELQSVRTPRISKIGRDKLLSYTSFKKMSDRILSIGLPFYAASKLGGERVAIVTLVSLAAELAMKTSTSTGQVAEAWKLIRTRKWTLFVLILQGLFDLFNLTTTSLPIQTLSGHLALSISILLLPLPFQGGNIKTARGIAEKGSNRISSGGTWELVGITAPLPPLISNACDTDLTVASGVIATVISFVVFVMSSKETQTLTFKLLLGGSIVAVASALSLLFADSRALLPSTTTISLGFALSTSLTLQELIDSHPLLPILFQSGLMVLSWLAVCLDMRWLRADSIPHTHQEKPPSRLTRFILHLVEDKPLLYRIFSKKDSRRIVYFMTMNASFMAVQGSYGYATGSLGLISDTVHMFFDCAALAMGLIASILGEKSSSLKYPYGFGKMDALAGFGNGVLLLAISIEIVYEAIERIASGSELHRLTELLIVSTGGLLVNLFGLAAFGHHGSHSHHGHDHGHDHGHEHGHDHSHRHDHNHTHSHPHHHESDCNHGHDHAHNHKENHQTGHLHNHVQDSPIPHGNSLRSTPMTSPFALPTPSTSANILPPLAPETHSHSHHGHSHHGHSHGGGSNMYGIYLHILADMMGSIAVILSTILVHYTGWSGWDAIASVMISYFITMATIPLVKSTAKELVLDIPETTEFDLRETLSGVGQLRGVVNITTPRFWLSDGKTLGVMHLVAAKGVDLNDVRERAGAYLKSRKMDILVQVEREGEGRCWCGSTAQGSNNRAA